MSLCLAVAATLCKETGITVLVCFHVGATMKITLYLPGHVCPVRHHSAFPLRGGIEADCVAYCIHLPCHQALARSCQRQGVLMPVCFRNICTWFYVISVVSVWVCGESVQAVMCKAILRSPSIWCIVHEVSFIASWSTRMYFLSTRLFLDHSTGFVHSCCTSGPFSKTTLLCYQMSVAFPSVCGH